jgi:hypothetical protein
VFEEEVLVMESSGCGSLSTVPVAHEPITIDVGHEAWNAVQPFMLAVVMCVVVMFAVVTNRHVLSNRQVRHINSPFHAWMVKLTKRTQLLKAGRLVSVRRSICPSMDNLTRQCENYAPRVSRVAKKTLHGHGGSSAP